MTAKIFVDFEKAKRLVTIPDVIASLGLVGEFRKTRSGLKGVCPIPAHVHVGHNPDQFTVGVKDDISVFHCFGCGRGGDVIAFIRHMMGYEEYSHVRLYLAATFPEKLNLTKPTKDGGSEPSKKARQESVQEPRRADIGVASPKISESNVEIKPLRFRLNLDPNVPYLRERGIEPETIKRFELGLCKKGLFAGYVAVPVYCHPQSSEANPVAYLGRWPGDDFDEAAGRPRYRWPENFPKSAVVYGLDEALDSEDSQPLIVVEGVFSVFALFQAGFTSSVAVFGSAISEEQIRLLTATGRQVVLLFDGDDAGERGACTAAATLVQHTFTRIVTLPPGCQPDNLTSEQLKTVLS